MGEAALTPILPTAFSRNATSSSVLIRTRSEGRWQAKSYVEWKAAVIKACTGPSDLEMWDSPSIERCTHAIERTGSDAPVQAIGSVYVYPLSLLLL
jgi:hypothetical protein